MELHRKLRPKMLKHLVGQDKAVQILRKMIKKGNIPHAIMLHGPSGCGKTTTAYILRDALKCDPTTDFYEINAADFRGIETIRTIRQRMQYVAMREGGTKVWLIDEAHQLSKDAQEACLKILEDPPDHVYFILCTTRPNDIIQTIRGRCSKIAIQAMSVTAMEELLSKACEAEKAEISEDVRDRIIEVSEGSAREALVILEQVLQLDDEEDQLATIQSPQARTLAFDLCKLLMNTKTKWASVAKAIEEFDDTNYEGFRYMVLSYCNKVILGGGKMMHRAFFISSIFEENWYDSKRSGLINSCYRVINKP